VYLRHFGLHHEPFGLTPDTACFFAAPTHQEALNVVLLGLRLGSGFVKVTGEIGLGKTLLCRRLLGALGGEYVTAYLPHPDITPAELRRSLARELASPERLVARTDTAALQNLLLLHARRGRTAVLFVDEAQRTPRATFEYIRLLTNLETETTKLLQVVLFGQPELDRRLARSDLRQLAQRVVHAYRLRPLSPAETEAYLLHRLTRAGGAERIFPRAARRAVASATRGVPRLINVCAHKALLAAYGAGAEAVAPAHVRAAVHDTESLRPHGWRSRLRIART
jgi:MSHA biogenesis protein MshM